ncbi:MAG: alpha/beta hydrolase [Deltaproteobacteria bacterium]|nr:alpha/beta hydrolase [Deltaproteobacteria bacterium]
MPTHLAGAGIACQFIPGSAQTGKLKTEFLKGGKGAPLLYLHGLSRPLGWDTDNIGLALHHSVYAPVLPGWKAGHLPPEIASVQDYARLMLAFMDAEKIEQADLVGHSVGGWISLHMALLAPERIERLVLVDSMGLDVAKYPATDISKLDETALYNAAFATKGVLVVAGDFGGVPLDLRGGALFKHILNGQRNMIALTGGGCGEPSLMPALKDIAADTLIVWGESDQLTPLDHAHLFAAQIRRSRVAIIEGAGHLPQKEKPQTFLRVVCNFLAGRDEPVEGTR